MELVLGKSFFITNNWVGRTMIHMYTWSQKLGMTRLDRLAICRIQQFFLWETKRKFSTP